VAIHSLLARALAILSLGALLGESAQAREIAVVPSSDNRIEVFVSTGSSSWIYHAYAQVPGMDLTDHRWVWLTNDLGLKGEDFVASRDTEKRIYVGAIQSGTIKLSSQNGPGTSFLAPLTLDTHGLHGLRRAQDSDGRFEFFALSNDGGAWSVAQNSVGDWTFGSHDLGGTKLQMLAPSPYKDGRIALTGLGGDHSVWWSTQYAPSGSWLPWSSLQGTAIQDVEIAANADGRAEIIALGSNGYLYDRYQLVAGGWSGWEVVSTGPFQGPMTVAADQDGRLEAFVRDAAGNIFHLWQTAPNGSWTTGGEKLDIPAGTDAQSVAMMNDGRLILVASSESGFKYPKVSIVGQLTPGGSWQAMNSPPLFDPPSPTINTFVSNPNSAYIKPNSRIAFFWTVSDCGADCTVTLQGADDCVLRNFVDLDCDHPFAHATFSGGTSPPGGVSAVPQNSTSLFYLTATNANGSTSNKSNGIEVTWDQSQQGANNPACSDCMTYLFEIEPPSAEFTCTKIAYRGTSEAAAQAALQSAWPAGWTVVPIDAQTFQSPGC